METLHTNTDKNISATVDRNLCTGCGICYAVCPANCIDFGWKDGVKVPIVDSKECLSCGSCYQVCPGRWIRGDRVVDSEYDRYLGTVDKSFIMVGSEMFMNRYTASGGFVTSFLAYLLDSKRVTGVLNVSLRDGNLKSAASSVITNVSDLASTTGSLYFTVPLGDGLKKLAEMDGQFAVVGLPCQIRGIRRLQDFSRLYRDKISVKIGLFCGFMMGYPAAEYLLNSLEIPASSRIKKISFRAECEGIDGFLIETDKNDYFIPRSEYTSILNRITTNKRCLMCNDMTSEEADVSCGDAHGYGEKKSLVISRSKEMTKLIRTTERAGYISIHEKLTKREVYHSQKQILKYKKETITTRLGVMRFLNSYIPEVSDGNLLSPNIYQKIGSFIYVLNCYLTTKRLVKAIFPFIPKKVVRFYGSKVYNLLQGKGL